MNVGERVREARLRRKMTVAGLAQASHLTKGFISQLESGRSNPSLASLGRISQALDIPLSRLISHDDDQILEPTEGPLVIATGNLYHEFSGLTALTSAQAGTHFLATIPPRFALSGSAGSQTGRVGPALAVVLNGMMEVSQGSVSASAPSGSLSTWDPDLSYSLENHSQDEAILLLFLPVGVARPTLVPLQTQASEQPLRPRHSNSSEGPLRLVAMRAERLAERRR